MSGQKLVAGVFSKQLENEVERYYMAEFSSTQNTGNLIKFIEGISSRGVPPKITIEHLNGLGFKSTNDRSIVTVLKGIGLCDSNGSPNDNYKKLRNKAAAKRTLAQLIRNSYPDLFLLYPDANGKDYETLKDFFASKTDVGEASLRNIIGTFQALCSIADFSGSAIDSGDLQDGANVDHAASSGRGHGGQQKHFSKTEVHFDIQIHLPGDQKPEIYESIFRNLGKYVLGNKDE
jgi:Family of unknown function (DUF5343)